MGNTVVVVEHDRETMEAADYIVDFGPGPGAHGGHVVAAGTLAQVAATPESVTGAYLAARETIQVPSSRRPINRPAARKRTK
jgi:excinuclease ABC subunit A